MDPKHATTRIVAAGTILVACGIALTAGAGGASMFGETRSIPVEWSAPKLVKNANGTVTYVPSVPTRFEQRTFGVYLNAHGVSVHAVSGSVTTTVEAGATRTEVVALPPQYDIRLKSGYAFRVQQDEQFEISGRFYKVLGTTEDGLLRVLSMQSGRECLLVATSWNQVAEK